MGDERQGIKADKKSSNTGGQLGKKKVANPGYKSGWRKTRGC